MRSTLPRAAALLALGVAFLLAHQIAPARDAAAAKKAFDEGAGHYRAGRIADADAAFSRAIRADVKNAAAYMMRAYCRVDLGRAKEAVADATLALSLSDKVRQAPVHHGALIARALARDRLGETRLALADCDAAVAVRPQVGQGYTVRGRLRLARTPERARGLADLATGEVLDAGPAEKVKEGDLDDSLAGWLKGWRRVTLIVGVPQFTETAPVTLHVLLKQPTSRFERRAERVYQAEVASAAVWARVVARVQAEAGALHEAERWDIHDTPLFTTRRGVRVVLERDAPRDIEVAKGRTLKLTRGVLDHFRVRAEAPAGGRTAVIISEAHDQYDQQLATLRGLEALLADNPWLKAKGESAFLVEAWPADKPLSLAALTKAAPRPSDALVDAALGTWLIPSYVAVAWKHRLDVPLIGHEDEKLYRLCNYLHWATAAGRYADEQQRRAEAIMGASVVARNQASGTAFVKALQTYHCPLLFIGHGHVGPYRWDITEKKDREKDLRNAKVEAGWLGGLLPAEPRGWLSETSRRSVAAHLKDAGIGYIHLEPRRAPLVAEGDRKRHEASYLALRKGQHDGKYDGLLAPYRPKKEGACTTAPAPDELASILSGLPLGGEDAVALSPKAREQELGELLGDCGTILGCFPAGTPVLTEAGPRRIEDIRQGQRVHGCDPATRRWGLYRVTATPSGEYDGDFVTVTAGATRITATGTHPFFVTRGEGLGDRPPAAHVPAEQTPPSTTGRWVNARDLRRGDVLLSRDGAAVVSALQSTQGARRVYTLRVETVATFAVGAGGLVVHNDCDFPKGLLRGDRGGIRLSMQRAYRALGWTLPERCEYHHLIPVAEAQKSELMRHAADKCGYSINRPSNGMALPNNAEDAKRRNLPWHKGSKSNHAIYSAYVAARLRQLDEQFTKAKKTKEAWNADRVRQALFELEKELRAKVKASRGLLVRGESPVQGEEVA